jgi:transcriptional/translational regulatory protein YebC/TACO1
VLSRAGGTMAEGGAVAWQFKRAAYFSFPAEGHDPDDVFMIAIEGGADDVNFDEETIEIIGPVDAFKQISDELKNAKIKAEEAELRYLPNNETELSVEQTIQVMKVLDALEELDDVQDVYSTLSISDDAMLELAT